MSEETYLKEEGLLVTSSRIDIDGQTFAVRNVGSVKVIEPSPPVLWGLILILSFIAAVVGNALLWGSVAVICLWGGYRRATLRRLVLMISGVEQVVYSSANRALVERLRKAVATAISVR